MKSGSLNILTRVRDLATVSIRVTEDGRGILHVATNMRRAIEGFAYYDWGDNKWHTQMPTDTPLETVAIFSKQGFVWALVVVTGKDTLIHVVFVKSKKSSHSFIDDGVDDLVYQAARQHYLHGTVPKEWEIGCDDEEARVFLRQGVNQVKKLFKPLSLKKPPSDKEVQKRIDDNLAGLLDTGRDTGG